MSKTVVIPAGTQLDQGHIAVKNLEFQVERRGDVYNAIWPQQGEFGGSHCALSVDDAIWLAKKDLCGLLDWIDSDNEDAAWCRRKIGQVLRESVWHHEGASGALAIDSVVLEGHLLQAGDGYEWSSLFISGLDLAEALAAAFRIEKLEQAAIRLWGHDDDGNPIDPDATTCTVVDGEGRLYGHQRLFYDFGRVKITIERKGPRLEVGE